MILGVRVSNSDYTYALLDGTRAMPQLIAHACVRCPAGFSPSRRLHWLHQEFTDLLSKHSVSVTVIKGAEGLATRGKAFVERTEMEAVVMLACFQRGIRRIERKVKSTIAKDLGLKGRGRYLSTLDTSHFADFVKMDAKLQEAILAGWSKLG